MRYPSELVIGFLAHNLSGPGRVLDMGCGSGRHAILAAEFGHESYGLDIADGGFSFCQNQASQKNVNINLKIASMEDTNYNGSYFDAVICYNSINANPLTSQKYIINEIYRILKPGGILLINFYGEKDWSASHCKSYGREVEQDTYLVSGDIFHQNDKNNMPDYLFHISNENEIISLFSSFTKVRTFDIYLPYGNASLSENYKPSHLIYTIVKK